MFIFKSNAIFSQKVERMNKNKRSFSYFAFIESREKNLPSPFSEINRDRLRVENTEKYICKNAHHRHFEVDPKWTKLLNERARCKQSAPLHSIHAYNFQLPLLHPHGLCLTFLPQEAFKVWRPLKMVGTASRRIFVAKVPFSVPSMELGQKTTTFGLNAQVGIFLNYIQESQNIDDFLIL